MNFKPLFIFIGYTLICISHANSQKITNISCIGNSITFGAGVVNREKNNFPQQLQSLLGQNYQVNNFGVSGTTLLSKGNLPYQNTVEYQKSLQSNPDIVIIELGTNDSKLINRPFFDDFENDYKAFIQSYVSLPSHPRILLLLPIPSFLKDSNSIYNPIIKEQIIPHIRQVAFDLNIELLDLYSLFIDKPELLPDQIHPSSLGATLISKRIYELVKLVEIKNTSIISKIIGAKKISSFYGYKCLDFTFNNRNCKIVSPKKIVTGMPWVWRARFWGHEPQVDIALLERGFHIVYSDVAELYGNEEAISLWDKFYAYMQQLGFAKKVTLEAMSRGGVYAYNWARNNPTKVAAIYADAPVLDLKSWPGGKGKGIGSKQDWTIFKDDYHLTEDKAIRFNNSPLDNAETIAKAHFPMLHVVGDADEVVPIDENTVPFEMKIKKAGGDITVIHKPGVGHHPHSLENPTLIVDFILKSTGYKTNFAVIASPASEYRSAAGWKEGTDWWVQNNDINQLLKSEKKIDIIFIGNSITQGIGGDRPSVTYKPGKIAFEKEFVGYNWVSAGISGDRTQHVLWRLQQGSYASAAPKFAVVTIGVNNFNEDSGEETALGIHEIIKWMRLNMPKTKIILIGPLPTGLQKSSSNRIKYEIVHRIIKNEANSQVIYMPLTKYFIKDNGDLDLKYCSGDGIHFVEPGYEIWAKMLKELMVKLAHKN